MWTGIARREHSREGLRYPADMMDGEWALIVPFVPPAAEMLSVGLDRQALFLRLA